MSNSPIPREFFIFLDDVNEVIMWPIIVQNTFEDIDFRIDPSFLSVSTLHLQLFLCLSLTNSFPKMGSRRFTETVGVCV